MPYLQSLHIKNELFHLGNILENEEYEIKNINNTLSNLILFIQIINVQKGNTYLFS